MTQLPTLGRRRSPPARRVPAEGGNSPEARQASPRPIKPKGAPVGRQPSWTSRLRQHHPAHGSPKSTSCSKKR
eukprot:16243764-Heterocapsa_arctica.AAC.1